MNKKITVLIFAAITLFACNKNRDKQAEAEKMVTEWIGKTIEFPSDMKFSIYGQDSLYTGIHDSHYKILFFADSIGCTSCKLRLFDWERLIYEVDTTLIDKVSFTFCFQPKNRKDLVSLFKSDEFNYPVFIDEQNEMNQLNHFPDKAEYQCFLLDKDNKVISIGNPARNPKIWDLYKQIIIGKVAVETQQNTQVEVIDKVMQLNHIKTEVKQKMTFRIKNAGDTPLIITDVKTSCDCTDAHWEKQPIAQGKTTTINAYITVVNDGYFEKTLSVYCNVENSPIMLKIKGNTE